MTGGATDEINKLKACLLKEFEIKIKDNEGIFLELKLFDQIGASSFLEGNISLYLLKETGMFGCRFVETPVEVNHRFRSDGDLGDLIDVERYDLWFK